MVFRLWSGMMMLVLLGIGFMWMFHIYLFEQNYVKAALTETQKRLELVMDDLSTQDLADDPRLLARKSHMAGGELILMNQQGKLIEMYSIGHTSASFCFKVTSFSCFSCHVYMISLPFLYLSRFSTVSFHLPSFVML